MFVSLAPSAFMTRCMKCKANITNLSLIPVIQLHFSGRMKDATAYELSTYGATLEFLKENFKAVQTSEYFPNLKLGIVCDGILNQDVTRLTFGDSVFDLITSNQVFEHVPDVKQGMRECFRVLKKGGSLVFSVPLYDTERTQQIARLKGAQIEWIEQPEYHDSRLGGPRSAPVFWRFSIRDITEQVRAGGFEKVEIVNISIAPSQGEPMQVIYAIK